VTALHKTLIRKMKDLVEPATSPGTASLAGLKHPCANSVNSGHKIPNTSLSPSHVFSLKKSSPSKQSTEHIAAGVSVGSNGIADATPQRRRSVSDNNRGENSPAIVREEDAIVRGEDAIVREDAIVSEGVKAGEENPDSLSALIQRKSDQQQASSSSSNGGGLARMDSLGKLPYLYTYRVLWILSETFSFYNSSGVLEPEFIFGED
jgi:hypothetical protein